MPIKQILISTVILLTASCSQDFRDRLSDGSPGPKMVLIPGGEFQMGDIQGDGDENEQPLHSVSVAPFAMGRYEVTVKEFRRFVEDTDYQTDAEKQDSCYSWVGDDSGNNWREPGFTQTDSHPVVCVSWLDATAYAKWLSEQTGHTYRLPTEAQWEYAARAGSITSRYWGNDPNEGCRYANVYDITLKQQDSLPWSNHRCTDGYVYTAPVGRLKPNAVNLFDMLGNVWEWTCSEYEDKYTDKEQRCVKSAEFRVFRGGAWNNGPTDVRTAFRYQSKQSNSSDSIGFRIARLTDDKGSD